MVSLVGWVIWLRLVGCFLEVGVGKADLLVVVVYMVWDQVCMVED